MGRPGVLSKLSTGWTASDSPIRAKRKLRKVPDPKEADLSTLLQDFLPYEGTEWWTARSQHSVAQLARLFEKGCLPIMLYEHIGAMYPTDERSLGLPIIVFQVIPAETAFEQELLDLCFEDAGIYLEELVTPDLVSLGLDQQQQKVPNNGNTQTTPHPSQEDRPRGETHCRSSQASSSNATQARAYSPCRCGAQARRRRQARGSESHFFVHVTRCCSERSGEARWGLGEVVGGDLVSSSQGRGTARPA